MFLYADRTVCPRCRAALPVAADGCDQCRAALDDSRAYDVFVALQTVDRLVGQLSDRPLVAAGVPAATVPAGAAPPVPPGPAMQQPAADLRMRAPLPIDRPAAVRPVMSGLTVPKILLGLGALCLVVAALVFLAVAWSALGVGGRTAVLVGFTAAAGGLAAWSARSGLRAGAESLTTVALGLFLLDLTGAHSSGWFGDLGSTGFAVLAGALVAGAGTAAAVATRRTKEPRLVSAEVVVFLGTTAALLAIAGFDWATPARWSLVATVTGAALALGLRSLRLAAPAIGVAAVAGTAWIGLVAAGITRAALHASWSGLWAEGHAWPLVAAAVLVAAPLAVRRVPAAIRTGAASAAVLLLTVAACMPGLDEALAPVTLTLVAVVATHTVAAWLLPHPWRIVTAAPLTLAGAATALLACMAALSAVVDSGLLDHGLWTDDATGYVMPWSVDGVWSALLPLTTAAALAALISLARVSSLVPTRRLLAPAITILVAAGSLSPVIFGVPRYTSVAAFVVAAGGLVAWALVRRQHVAWIAVPPLGILALGTALADDGLTIAVLALLTAAFAAASTGRAPGWLREVSGWALPVALGATTWAIASASGLDGTWRAAPVIAAVALLALGRPAIAPEVSGLGVALVAITVSAAFEPGDLRIVAGQLAATGLVATLVGVLRRSEGSLAGMALLGAAGLAAWPDTATAVVVLSLGLAVTVLHEVRRTAPADVVARAATPVAAGGLLWSAADLVGLSGAWIGVPAVVVLGALLAWRADPVREIPAGFVGGWTALAAVAPLADPQAWTAVYLTLGGVAFTVSALLHVDRRRFGWVGLTLLTLATWLRLEQLGVGTVEAYTLPLAVVLLVVGTVALLRGDRSTLQTQGAGLGLALVPSLLQVLAEPVALRAVLLGAGAIALVAVGVQRRWAAPLLAGGSALTLLVLRQMTIAQVLPQWALIGLAGVALTFVGLTWEKRLANVRTAAGYVRGLR